MTFQSALADSEDNAMSLYFSGKDAYNSGNYQAAQNFFLEALVKDENIEAKAQNIKYMLGVSAFNNRDYKTAKTYLSLFEDNPIAIDLLQKIEEFEKTLPEDFLYHNDSHNVKQQIDPSATKTEIISSETKEEENNSNQATIIIIITTMIIMSLSVFVEIKKSLFSKIALKLVGVSSDSIITKVNDKTNKDAIEKSVEITNDSETSSTEINSASLLETPFDEEIDIDKMASQDIEEISRFFEEEHNEEISFEDASNKIKKAEVPDNTKDNEEEVFETARDSILNSILDEDENKNQEREPEQETIEKEEQIPENIQRVEISKKPKYEHLDNIPDDFNVNVAIEKAFKMIEETNRLNKTNEEDKTEEFKTIEELEKEIEEKEKINLNYFQDMKEMDKDYLNSFFDYIFEEHLEVSKK